MMNHYIIDRIEEGLAVLEGPGGRFTELPLAALPLAAKEGSALTFENGVWTLRDNSAGKARVRRRFDLLIKRRETK